MTRGRRTSEERATYDKTRYYHWRDSVDLGPLEQLRSLVNKGWLETYSGMGRSYFRRCHG